MDSSLEYYELTFCVYFYGLCFKVYFAWCKHCYPNFFFPVCLLGIFFSNSSLSVCIGLLFWSGSLISSMWSCFLIHPATLCFLIGAFNLFTFKVIIDRYLFIAIYFFGTCVPLSPTLFLPFLKAVPLASLAVLVWRRCILWAFFCLRNSLFHLWF